MSIETMTVKVDIEVTGIASVLTNILEKDFCGRTVTREEIRTAEKHLHEVCQSLVSVKFGHLEVKPRGNSEHVNIDAILLIGSGSTLTVPVATRVKLEPKAAALERVLAPYAGNPVSTMQKRLHDLKMQVFRATGEDVYASSFGKHLRVIIRDGDLFIGCQVPLVASEFLGDKDIAVWMYS